MEIGKSEDDKRLESAVVPEKQSIEFWVNCLFTVQSWACLFTAQRGDGWQLIGAVLLGTG